MRDAVYEAMAHDETVHWWFLGRRRILQSVLEWLSLPHHARILEIGAGTGGNIPLLSCFGTVTAVEPNPRARAWIAEKTGLAAVDCKLPDVKPLRDAQFDLIAMLDVLEHIEDATGTLRALSRHLASGGRFLVTVPAYRFLWSSHDESLQHFRRYTRRTLAATVAEANLSVVRMRYFNTLLFPAVAAVRFVLNVVGAKSIDEVRVPPSPINAVLATLFSAERHFVLTAPMPFGVSLLAVLER